MSGCFFAVYRLSYSVVKVLFRTFVNSVYQKKMQIPDCCKNYISAIILYNGNIQGNLLVQVIFLLVAIILKSILRKMIVINLQKISKNVMLNMFTRSGNIRGGNVWFVSMTRTGILSKWAKI